MAGPRFTVHDSRFTALRLLIVRLSSMGDVIHALPLAANAHAAGARVGWLVERAFAGLLAGNPSCDEVIVADTRGWRRAAFSPRTFSEARGLARRLRAFSPTRTIDAQGLWKSAVAARLAGAPVAGFAAEARREPASASLCAVLVTPGPAERHVVDRNLALLAAAGIPIRSRAPDARHLLGNTGPAADAWLASVPRPFALYHPGAAREEKAWGEDRFAALAERLARNRGLRPVVSWGPGDERRLARMRALLPEAVAAPALDFAGLARAIAASALFVSGDTGPLHLADALGARTLALFGPTDPERNGPYRFRDGIVTRMREVTDAEVLERAIRVAGPGAL